MMAVVGFKESFKRVPLPRDNTSAPRACSWKMRPSFRGEHAALRYFYTREIVKTFQAYIEGRNIKHIIDIEKDLSGNIVQGEAFREVLRAREYCCSTSIDNDKRFRNLVRVCFQHVLVCDKIAMIGILVNVLSTPTSKCW